MGHNLSNNIFQKMSTANCLHEKTMYTTYETFCQDRKHDYC